MCLTMRSRHDTPPHTLPHRYTTQQFLSSVTSCVASLRHESCEVRRHSLRRVLHLLHTTHHHDAVVYHLAQDAAPQHQMRDDTMTQLAIALIGGYMARIGG